MKKSRFTEQLIVKALRDADAGNVVDVAKKLRVAEQTPYVRRKRFRGQTVDEVKEMKSFVLVVPDET